MAILKPALALTLLLGAACGTQGNAEADPDDWPRTPLRNFALLDEDQPYALLRLGWDLDQPAVAPVPADGMNAAAPLVVWGRMSPRQQPEQSVLFCTPLPDLHAAAPPPSEPALAPVAAWEGMGLSSPAWLAGEPDLPPLLFYQGSDGSVGVAKGVGDCAVARLTTDRPLLPATALASGKVDRISVLRTGAEVRLYYLVDGQHAHFAQLAVAALQQLAAGTPVTVQAALSPSVLGVSDFQIKQSAVVTLPAERLDGLYVRRMTTPLGRDRFDLYATATAMMSAAIVSAASYSGGSLSDGNDRFLAVESAALATSAGVPRSATVATYKDAPLMLLGWKTVQTGIAAAMQPASP